MDLSNITLNGEPLTSALATISSRPRRLYVSEEEKIARAVRVHTTTKRWNRSGARTGRGRVIMQNGVLQKIGTA